MADNEGVVKAAIFSGIFVVIAACITGVFLLANTLLEQGIVIVGPGVQIGDPQSESATSTSIPAPGRVPSTNSLCPMIVIEGTVGGLPIAQTKTWSELGYTTREPQSAKLDDICSRTSDNEVKVWIGYWSVDPGYLDFRGEITPDAAISLVKQNPNQPVIIVPWGE